MTDRVHNSLPKPPDFPDPRTEHQRSLSLKPKVSVDTILKRTDPDKRSVSSLVYLGVEDYFGSLEAEETALREREREVARVRAETYERIRAVKETELLLAARDKVLDEREAMLDARMEAEKPDERVAVLEQSLRATRVNLKEATTALEGRDKLIAELREEMKDLKAQLEARPEAPATAGESAEISYAQVTHRSLADQVEFLQEREAFIEESENTLFEKAQNLQEWETRLQQIEHDLGNGGKGKRSGQTPIHFPNAVNG